jgi:hypothetical protein
MTPPVFGPSANTAVPRKQPKTTPSKTRLNMIQLSEDAGKRHPFNALVRAQTPSRPVIEDRLRQAHMVSIAAAR